MQLWGINRLLLRAAALFLLWGCSGSSSHSMSFKGAVWDSAEGLPLFIFLGYLDDQLFIHHEQKTGQAMTLVPWMKQLAKDNPEYWNFYNQRTSGLPEQMRQRARIVQKYTNQNESFHVWQRIFLCELMEDEKKKWSFRFAYNGRDIISFDKDAVSWIIVENATAPGFQREWETATHTLQYYKHILEEECFGGIQMCMKYANESLSRREPPVVKVLRKINHNGLETLICQAYGFYPRKIHATWEKDGEFLEKKTFHGDVAPNSDGTYHTWISIEIDPKDRGHYRCHMEHVGFSEPSLFAWKEPASVGPTVGGILGAMAALVLLVAGIIFYIKKQQGGYKGTSTSAPEIHRIAVEDEAERVL